ncbi:hypothetical protein [Actinoplanes aureus]|uniref:Uncharacterized protein n=1 Tax=Actinoplanes aureus TaxID=2792083 RepID=A0A931C749_9ACTN|nr:hypothetical protein [Actinoplanes aureus]MBG0560703.1 hypothetical protein [Actinoplanes aureus]
MTATSARRLVVEHGPRTTERAKPHEYDADPDSPGTCRCRLIKAHRLHDPAAVAEADAVAREGQEEQLRRLGERQD